MLEFELTPHHAGMTLWGDYYSLRRLHEFIHNVVEQSDYIEDKEGFVLGLAYDVRKAFGGDRRVDTRGFFEDEQCRIYGVEVLWPTILVQIGMLRQAMAFMPTNKLDQALMFELEHVVESAIRKAMPITADGVIYQIRNIGSMSYMHIDGLLDSRCRYFIQLPAKQRLKELPKLMETFDLMYAFLNDTESGSIPGVIPPGVFIPGKQEWPDFEW